MTDTPDPELIKTRELATEYARLYECAQAAVAENCRIIARLEAELKQRSAPASDEEIAREAAQEIYRDPNCHSNTDAPVAIQGYILAALRRKSAPPESVEEIAFKASDEIFRMFAGILHRINDRIEHGFFQGLGEEAAAVKFDDVQDVIKAAIAAATAKPKQ